MYLKNNNSSKYDQVLKSFFSLFSHQCKIKSLFVKRFILNNKGWTKFRYRNDFFRKLKEKPVNERQKPLIFKSLYRLYVSKLCIYLYSVFTCNLYLLVLYLYSEFTCTLYMPVLYLYSVFTCTLYILSSCFIYALLNLVHTIPVLCIYL